MHGMRTRMPDQLASWINRGQMGACGQDIDVNTVGGEERVSADIKEVYAAPEPVKGWGDILVASDFQRGNREPERAGSRLNFIHLQYDARIAHISQDRQPAQRGHDLAQQF